ncbi:MULTISPECIES: GGDEF domain-containing protein [unclassified Devosia]|uniref:GGDEF domain-containing protein n=1 Tax=unclassified Devosia TaxID=196773 RepID=UPI0015FAF1D4|nr:MULTISPECIES: GGDEF domain-containing protein [unclassified Devosia]MBJ6986025.1 GGDEF domain-containing protein [Devosia sp. MC521]MBK1793510.1 GGDEF domain-containing protein [Devosia sp. WQ 349K1]QMW61396.1 GGDEF domain-containing protein [Devosia sp. MC521]
MSTTTRRTRFFWEVTTTEDQDAARAALTTIIKANTDRLVSIFYDIFLEDETASAFLSHGVVQQRLSPSLRAWMLDLMSAQPTGDLTAFNARQIKIGEIHARLKIPVQLVLAGGSVLKTEIGFKLIEAGYPERTATNAIMMVDDLIDYAMRLMSAAYFKDTKRHVRNDEAFRLFSLGQDINLERETQRAALMEWSQTVLFGLFGNRGSEAAGTLSSSTFGLWIRHRAGVLFHGSPILPTIEELMLAVDKIALPRLNTADPNTVADLQRRVDEIKYLINDLFQSASSVENGRDPLTRTLNRRFLPSVLSRELSMAQQDQTPLSVLMVDIDHFKTINDQYSHSIGDLVLSHTAETLLSSVRSSDFVFRYGGEEFLIVLVETGAEEAALIAERIRNDIQSHAVNVPGHGPLLTSVSIGVATHGGHPDYEYLINSADRALYTAKNSGRNRISLAPSAPNP